VSEIAASTTPRAAARSTSTGTVRVISNLRTGLRDTFVTIAEKIVAFGMWISRPSPAFSVVVRAVTSATVPSMPSTTMVSPTLNGPCMRSITPET
jgi:hypothetical protein